MPKVRDAIRLVARNGWRLVGTRGSHRQSPESQAKTIFHRGRGTVKRSNPD